MWDSLEQWYYFTHSVSPDQLNPWGLDQLWLTLPRRACGTFKLVTKTTARIIRLQLRRDPRILSVMQLVVYQHIAERAAETVSLDITFEGTIWQWLQSERVLSAFSPRIQVTKLRHKTLAPLRNSEVLAGLRLWSLHCPSGVDKYTPHSSCRPNIWWVHLESSASLHHVNVSLWFCLEGLDHMQILVACCRAAKAKEVFRALAIPNSPLVHQTSWSLNIHSKSLDQRYSIISNIINSLPLQQIWADLSLGQLKTFLEKDAKRGFQCAGPLLRFSLFEVGTVGVSAIGLSATKLVRSAGKRRASRRWKKFCILMRQVIMTS